MTLFASPACERRQINGIAAKSWIAAGFSQAFVAAGAELAATQVREAALPHAREVNEPPGYRPQRHRDARETRKQEAVFARHATDWGGPGLLLQAIAFAPHADVHRRMVDCGSAGYPSAIDVAVRSFLRLAQPAEPLTQAGDCLFSATLHRRKHDSSRFRSARDGMSPPR